MGFLDRIFGHKHHYDALEDEPITGYDPAASQSKVNDYLGNSQGDSFGTSDSFGNPTQQPTTQDPFGADSGLPPDPSANDPILQNNSARMSNGMNAQDMASRYMKQQEHMASQQPQNQPPTHQEEVLNLKLESMKNQLEAINQRIQRIEQLLQQNNKRW